MIIKEGVTNTENCHESGDAICNRTIHTGDQLQFIAQNDIIVFLTEGQLLLSKERNVNVEIKSPQMFLIPSGSSYERMALSDCTITIIRLKPYTELSNSLEMELGPIKRAATDMLLEPQKGLYSLTITPMIFSYLRILDESISRGLSCPNYLEMKIKELLYIMEMDYTKRERQIFFEPLITKDQAFVDFVYKNYDKVKSVRELAELSFYSISGFEKRFRRAFGKSATHWINEKKATDIYQEIRKGDKTFKEISIDYDFSSPSHFSAFCKTYLGNSPSQLRGVGSNL